MNKDVKAKADEIKRMLGSYSKRSDLDDVLDNIINSGIVMKYDYTAYTIVFASLSLLGIFLSAISWDNYLHVFGSRYDAGIVFAVFAAVCSLALLYPMFKKNSLNEISDTIYNLDLYDDNKLVFQNERDEYCRINNRFGCLEKGNHENIFQQSALINGTPFKVHEYKFVDKTTWTTTDAKGNVTTHTSYSTYYRYMLEMALNKETDFIAVVHDSSYDLDEFSPSSINFSDDYKCLGRDIHQVSKLVDPSFIHAMNDINKKLGLVNVRVSDDVLLLEWKDYPVFSKERKFGIESPVEFKKEISGHSSIYAVDTAKEFATLICKQIDLKF